MKTEDLELKGLGQFIGTEHYYKVFGVYVTDGVKYIMENGYRWLVTDAIAVIKYQKQVKKYLEKDRFLSIKLHLLEDYKARVTFENNDKIIYTQNYDFTDAKREITLFYVDNVLMLNSEY